MVVSVTGASGFIGSALVNALEKKRIIVHALSRKKNQNSANVRWFRGDLEKKIPKNFLRASKILFHLAGYAKERQNLKKNLEITKSLFSDKKLGSIKKVIFLSSCAVYNKNVKHVNEASSLTTIDCYGKSKIENETFIIDQCIKRNLQYQIFRPSIVVSNKNNFGPFGVLDKIFRLTWFPLIFPEKATVNAIQIDDLINVLVNHKKIPVNSVYNLSKNFQWSKIIKNKYKNKKIFIILNKKQFLHLQKIIVKLPVLEKIKNLFLIFSYQKISARKVLQYLHIKFQDLKF